MPAYRPGQGISRESMERLRERVESRGASLPSVDQSKQWEGILGEGARNSKKTRCFDCTRPLPENCSPTDFLCLDCARGQVLVPESRKKDLVKISLAAAPLKCHNDGTGLLTPSTQFSEDADATVAAPVMESVSILRPPTPAQVTLAVLKKGLSGAWRGHEGEIYRILFNTDACWTCVLEGAKPSKTVRLTFDQEENIVWWGVEFSHFLSAFEVCEQPDQLTWHQNGTRALCKTDFVWYRPQKPANEAEQFDSYSEARKSALQKIDEQLPYKAASADFFQGAVRVRIPRWSQSYQKWLGDLRSFLEACPERFKLIPGVGGTFLVARAESELEHVHCRISTLEAGAVREIEAQLRTPGNQGFVWVDQWNERYLRHLGSLRDFLESNSDKFTIIPGKGKSFRVALAGCAQEWSWRQS